MKTKYDLNTLAVSDLSMILNIKPRSLHALIRRPASLSPQYSAAMARSSCGLIGTLWHE
jgi:hypothetical protein